MTYQLKPSEAVLRRIITYAVHTLIPLGRPTDVGAQVIRSIKEEILRELTRRLGEYGGRGYERYVFVFRGHEEGVVGFDNLDELPSTVSTFVKILLESLDASLDALDAEILVSDSVGALTVYSGRQLYDLIRSVVLDAILSDPSIILENEDVLETQERLRSALVLLVGVSSRLENLVNYCILTCASGDVKCGGREGRWLIGVASVIDGVWEGLDSLSKSLLEHYVTVEATVRACKVMQDAVKKLGQVCEGLRKYVTRKYPKASDVRRRFEKTLRVVGNRLTEVEELLADVFSY